MFAFPGLHSVELGVSDVLVRRDSDISEASSYSTSTFATALVFNAAVFGGELLAFTLVWRYFPAIYHPRTYVPPEGKRAPPFARNFILWPLSVFRANYADIKNANGLDAYFFVRYLRMMARVFFPIWIISWLILLPVYSVHTSNGESDSLTQFQFGNVGTGQQARLWAPLILTWLFTVWICWNIRHEMSHFVTTRQQWLIDPSNSSTAQANTILVTGVPKRYLTESALKDLFSHLPGGVAKVWLNRDLKEMPDLYDRQVAACLKLESAETQLLNTAVKRHNKRIKAAAKAAKKSRKKGGKDVADIDVSSDNRHLTDPSFTETDAERGDILLAEKLVPKKKRPTHRLPLMSFLPSLPLVGKKVDSIDWAREEIIATAKALKVARKALAREIAQGLEADASGRGAANSNEPDDKSDALKPDKDTAQTYPPLNSAFVLFNEQIAAHLAAQSLTHHVPYRMAEKHLGVVPDDVIWGNLNMNPYEAKIRIAISWAFTLGLIILWSFPVAFVGAVSNIRSLCATYSWLAWLCKLPAVVIGIISGVLSPVLLAVLMMLLPIVLRLLARFQGMTTRSAVELSLMHRYFMFLIIHSFLIVTVSSGIIAALPSLVEDTSSIPSMLAQHLPQASTFFLAYIILQGLSGTATGFLAYVSLAIYYVKLYLMGSTPRSIYHIKYQLQSAQWGSTFPSVTLLTCITIAYSVISPIINGLSAATFFLFYMLWKYRLLWQLGQPRSAETGGQFFPKAMQHVFIGLYVEQICLAALFFLAQDESKHASAIPEGALMIVLIAFTAFFHVIINNSYDPLIEYLPLTLANHDRELPDPNRVQAERELRDNESVSSAVEPTKAERRHSQNNVEMRARTGPESCTLVDSKGKARNVEDVERDDDDDDTRQSDKDNAMVRKSILGVDDARQSDKDNAMVRKSILGLDEEAGPKDFYHPASVEPQQTIWIPVDLLGLGKAEEEVIREQGIKVTTKDAHMDEKGHVNISGEPPDYEPPIY